MQRDEKHTVKVAPACVVVPIADCKATQSTRVFGNPDLRVLICQWLGVDDWLALSSVSRGFLQTIDRNGSKVLWSQLVRPGPFLTETVAARTNIQEYFGPTLATRMWHERYNMQCDSKDLHVRMEISTQQSDGSFILFAKLPEYSYPIPYHHWSDQETVMLLAPIMTRSDVIRFRCFYRHLLDAFQRSDDHARVNRDRRESPEIVQASRRLYAARDWLTQRITRNPNAEWRRLSCSVSKYAAINDFGFRSKCYAIAFVLFYMVLAAGPLFLLPLKLDGLLNGIPYTGIFAPWLVLFAVMTVPMFATAIDLVRSVTCLVDESTDPGTVMHHLEMKMLEHCKYIRAVALTTAATTETGTWDPVMASRFVAVAERLRGQEELAEISRWEVRVLSLTKNHTYAQFFGEYGALTSFVLAMLRIDGFLMIGSWHGILASLLVPMCADLLLLMTCALVLACCFKQRHRRRARSLFSHPQHFIGRILFILQLVLLGFKLDADPSLIASLSLGINPFNRHANPNSAQPLASVPWPAVFAPWSIMVACDLFVFTPQRLKHIVQPKGLLRLIVTFTLYSLWVFSVCWFAISLFAFADSAWSAWLPIQIGLVPFVGFVSIVHVSRQ